MNKKAIAFGSVSCVLSSIYFFGASPVLAHHPSGGELPSTFIEGLVSGIGHPVIGIDHLVFVVAIGLLAALSKKIGMIIPLAFVVATAIGTAIHLQSISLPVPELIISASVLMMGILLAKEKQINLAIIAAIAAMAGIFHGYAYAESIVGAQTTVVSAYLLGFCSIQLGISAIAFYVGRSTIKSSKPAIWLRFAGFAICGIGFAFVSNSILG